MQLRKYQTRIAFQCVAKVQKYGLCYLAMEVRTGKTITSLAAAELITNGRVLFLTKKKAISSIQSDYDAMDFNFELVVVNNESMHKVEGDFNLIISDEHHRNSSYPKPNKGTRYINERWGHLPMIFLSGTPYPESYSQVFHSYWVSNRTPFQAGNFYKWAKEFVNVKQQRRAGGFLANDYSDAKWDKIEPIIKDTMITFSQSNAGFTSEVVEHVLPIKMKQTTAKVIRMLKKDKIVIGRAGEIIGDTPVKLMQKVHQLSSGTCKLEDGSSIIIDTTKAEFIRDKFKGKKIGIFYKFKAEWDMLKQVFGDSLTNDLDEFNATNKDIALQIQSGREGITLRQADALVYFNIDFSAVSYWQSRDRLTTMERLVNDVYWVFNVDGIEGRIYERVIQKKDYNLAVFKNELSN